MLDFSFSNILHSNIINFAIMIALFVFIGYKLKVGQKIEDMRVSIKNKVEESDAIKEEAKKDYEREAKKDYESVADSLSHIEDELNAIVAKAEETAKSFEQKARVDLDKSVALLKQNIEKQVETEQNHVQGELLHSVAASSIEIAQKQIKTALNKDKQLHRKYIEDFINSIDKTDV